MEKDSENERIQEHRPFQKGRKEIEKMTIMIYNRFFQYCETPGQHHSGEFIEAVHESGINASSDSESLASQLKQEKCPTSLLIKFRKHDSVNLYRLKKTAKQNS